MFFPSTEDKTREIAHTFAQLLKPGDIVCLDGDLGAGKTTFVKGIATRFNNNMDDVTSPTFVYLNIYDQLAHFDLYRIETEKQFCSMGFEEYMKEPYITCIEWPNVIKSILPKHTYWVSLSHHEKGRNIIIKRLDEDDTTTI